MSTVQSFALWAVLLVPVLAFARFVEWLGKRQRARIDARREVNGYVGAEDAKPARRRTAHRIEVRDTETGETL